MTSINDITKQVEDSPVKKKRVPKPVVLSHSDKLRQPSLKDYEEWMILRTQDLNIENLEGLNIIIVLILNILL